MCILEYRIRKDTPAHLLLKRVCVLAWGCKCVTYNNLTYWTLDLRDGFACWHHATSFWFPHNVQWLLVTWTADTCWPMRRPKYALVTPLKKNMKPKPNMSITGCMLLCRLLVLFPVRDLYFYILLQPCYGTLPLAPPADKAGIVYLLQPLGGNALNSHFFFCSLWSEFSWPPAGVAWKEEVAQVAGLRWYLLQMNAALLNR